MTITKTHRFACAAVASAAALALSGTARAAITTYTTSAAMTAATTLVATDSFNNLALDFLASPARRTIGPYSYGASAPQGLYAIGTSSDVWLSTDSAGDALTFGNFTGGVRALGGLFFATGTTGDLLPGQTLTLTATDSGGATATLTLTNPTASSFAGFVSTVQLTQVQVAITNLGGWVTANNVMLGGAVPVPEPATWAMWLAGVLGVGGCALRRRRSEAQAQPV